MTERLKRLIREMPKGENHIHIEGSVSGETCFTLAKRKGITLPFASPQILNQHFFTHVKDLDSFLECYRLINDLCVDEADYYDIVLSIGEDAKAQNIIYRELMLDFPLTANIDGRFGKVITACYHASQQIENQHGIHMPIIVCVDRSQPLDDCANYVEGFAPYLHMIDGIGLDYEEVDYPPHLHSKTFEVAKRMGLYRTCHVQDSSQNLWEALEVLGCRRIDHGTCAMEDPKLLKKLAQERIMLTICPTSNVITGIYNELREHDLKRLMAAGVPCSINSDDPAFFGNLTTELERCVEQLQLTEEAIVACNRNSFLHSIRGQQLVCVFDDWYNTFRKRWKNETGERA